VIERILQAMKIRPGETAKVALMFLYLFVVVSVFISGRITRDALFLDAFTKEALAYMYVTVAVAVPFCSYLYARVADRFRRDKIIISTLVVLGASLVLAHVLVAAKERWVLIALYNWIEVVGAFLIIQFWTFAADIFSSREAKRLFPIIGLGGIFASMLAGIGVTAATSGLGIATEHLLLPQGLFLFACVGIVWHLGQRERPRLQEATVGRHARTDAQGFRVKSEMLDVFKSKHLKLIAAMTVATFITVPLIDYQFKVVAKEHFAGVDAYSAFMGVFYSVTGALAALMQFGLTGRLLERFGVVVSLLVLPLFLLAGSAGLVLGVSAFFMAVLSKGAENTFRYSIYDATMQVIYTPVPGHVRGRAKTFIDGILKPWAGGIAGGIITLMVGPLGRPVSELGWAALALTGLWIFLILRIRREYVSQLLSSLRRHRLDFSDKELVISDEATVQVLRRTLRTGSVGEVRNAAELVRRVVSHDLSADVVELLKREEPDIRVCALEILAQRGSMSRASRVEEMFKDPDKDVRAAATRAFCAIVGQPALRVVRPHLESDSPEVRCAAVASLIKHGGVEGILVSAEHLRAMQTSLDEHIRFAAASVFSEIGVKNFYQPVMALMRDPSLRVQNAAIAAAGAMKASELIPALIYKLGKRETARAAGLALSEYGDAVSETLGKVLSHDAEDVGIRRQVPRILERIGSARCLELLMACLGVKDPDARRETAMATARLRERLAARVDEAVVRKILEEEIREHYQQLAALEDLSAVAGTVGPDLLRDAIQERLERALDRIFRLLGIIYPRGPIELIHSNLKSTALTTRANAIELLDNLLEKDLKRRLLPIIEDLPRERVLALGAELFSFARRPPEYWIAQFLTSREPWLGVVALYVVAELGLSHLREEVLAHLGHRDPVARETAVRTLAVLLPAADFVHATCDLLEDEDHRVRAYSAYIVGEARRFVQAAEGAGEVSGPVLRAPAATAAGLVMTLDRAPPRARSSTR
jgi:ATP/ADP translocase/HEAT repeat protein